MIKTTLMALHSGPKMRERLLAPFPFKTQGCSEATLQQCHDIDLLGRLHWYDSTLLLETGLKWDYLEFILFHRESKRSGGSLSLLCISSFFSNADSACQLSLLSSILQTYIGLLYFKDPDTSRNWPTEKNHLCLNLCIKMDHKGKLTTFQKKLSKFNFIYYLPQAVFT